MVARCPDLETLLDLPIVGEEAAPQPVDVDALSVCAIQHIDEYKALSEKELAEEYELLCGCESVPLRQLLGDYACQRCGEVYWFPSAGRTSLRIVARGIVRCAARAEIGGSGTANAATNARMASRCRANIVEPKGLWLTLSDWCGERVWTMRNLL